jgi:hypothetical protein
LRYCPFYCEENIFHLSREPALRARPREVVFISNEHRACAMWHQRAAAREGWPILWDYHVILLVSAPWEVWDLDTRLGLPVPAADYLRRSFRAGVHEEVLPRFRVVEAEAFASMFASDRSHMRLPSGRFRKKPPAWPPIGPPGGAPNLMRFVDVTSPFVGEVLDLAGMLAHVSDA